ACSGQEPPVKVRSRLKTAVELRIDPRTLSPARLMNRVQLPDPYSTDAAAALNHPPAFERVIARFLRSRPVLPGFPREMVHNNRATIANYRAGVLQLGGNPATSFAIPLRWDQEDLGANHLNELHSFRFLTNFIDEYHRTGRSEYFDITDRVLADWLEHNPYGRPAHRRAWYEGTVSKRLLVLLYLVEKTRSIDLPRQVPLRVLLAMLHQNAEYLMSAQTYKPNGNHGMRQDQALLTAALAAPYFKRSREWMRTALTRLRTRQIETGFSLEGVWKEHSPTYHRYVMNMLENIFGLIELNHLPEDAGFLHALRAKSQHYLSHVLTPLGRFPPVGDSDESILPESHADSPPLLYTLTRGSRGTPPDELDGFFPDAGEVVFRDTWGRPDRPADQALYIHMHAALHPGFGHRHADELSFVLHALGRWWILETGKHSYDPGPIRDHVESAPAHNGITFNGRGMRALDMKDPARTVSFEPKLFSTPEFAAVRATSTRFRRGPARATRSFIFMRDRQALLLLDHVQSDSKGTWQWYFHLPPDAQLTVDEATVRVTVPTHPSVVMSIVTESAALGSNRISTGQTDPLLGWYSPGFREWVPAPVLVSERQGSELTAATLIQLHDAKLKSPTSFSTRRQGDMSRISWLDVQGKNVSLRIPISGPLSIAEGE
ncbi:MAG: heparinase II/III domain-containing protein, partial [Gammaproteobacteria bacterium]